jgi:translation initiation factor 1
MKKNDWKKREGVVYSTNSEFIFSHGPQTEPDTLAPAQQRLRVKIDTSGRAGKVVTLVTGFVGRSDDLEALGKVLKAKCGTGGACKDGDIMIQGDQRDKILNLLLAAGYRAKRSG